MSELTSISIAFFRNETARKKTQNTKQPGGDIAIKLSYVLERCPHFDPDSSSAWFADAAAAQDYSVLAKWGKMTKDFDEYTTRLSNSLNEIGMVRGGVRGQKDFIEKR